MPAREPKLITQEHDANARLAQASAEYRKLAASLSALGTQLAALGMTIEGSGSVEGPANEHPAGRGAVLAVEPAPTASGKNGVPHAPVIEVQLLGPFAIYANGRNIVAAAPAQVQTVLKYALSQGSRPTSRDTLLDLLWPECDPAVTGSRLRVLMHTLRRSIPCQDLGFRDLIVLSGNNFVVNPEAHLWVDVEEFERRWLSGWRLARAGRIAEALQEYELAEALYTGDYLEDDPYADWTLLRREALRDAYSTILTMLATMSLQAGDYTGAIIWAQKLLSQDNCREDAYRLLMKSHHQLGQVSRALYWYSLCARTMQRELSMEPSLETQELFRSLATP